jgi:DNA-binding MarR family transcriptional regulator
MSGRTAPLTAEDARHAFDETHRAIGRLLGTARMELLSALDRELAAFHITAAQHAILAALAEGCIDSASALCRAMSYDAGAMTRMIDRLESKGLIRRVPWADDRRKARLELTDEGRAAYPLQKAAGARVFGRYLQGFTPAEARQLHVLLQRMVEGRASDIPATPGREAAA